MTLRGILTRAIELLAYSSMAATAALFVMPDGAGTHTPAPDGRISDTIRVRVIEIMDARDSVVGTIEHQPTGATMRLYGPRDSTGRGSAIILHASHPQITVFGYGNDGGIATMGVNRHGLQSLAFDAARSSLALGISPDGPALKMRRDGSQVFAAP